MYFKGEQADAVLSALNEIETLADKSEYWNVSSAKDQFCECLSGVELGQPESVKTQSEKLLKAFSAKPKTWFVDLLVSGASLEWHDLKFGKLTFLSEAEELLHSFGVSPLTKPLRAKYPVPPLLVRVQVSAVNEASAVDKAKISLARHLAVLNGICSDGFPSKVRFIEGFDFGRTYNVYRISGCDGEDGQGF